MFDGAVVGDRRECHSASLWPEGNCPFNKDIEVCAGGNRNEGFIEVISKETSIMKTCILRSLLAAAYFLLLHLSPVHAATTVKHEQFIHEKRLATVGGTLAARANRKDDSATDVVLKDKVVATIEDGPISFDYKFSVGGTDVVLFHAAAGASCPAVYYFLLVGADGKTVFSGKDGFGNCSDVPTLVYDDKGATLSSPSAGDGRPSKSKQVERWVWDYSAKPPVKLK
jgi:hypothetical protein